MSSIPRRLADLNYRVTLDACTLQKAYDMQLQANREKMPELYDDSAQSYKNRGYVVLLAALGNVAFTFAALNAPAAYHIQDICRALGSQGEGAKKFGDAINLYLEGRGGIYSGRISLSMQDKEELQLRLRELTNGLSALGQVLQDANNAERQMIQAF